MARPTKQLRRARIWLDVSIIGIQFPVAIALGYFFGRWLDGLLKTTPWLTIIFALFGITAGFINLFRITAQAGRSEEQLDAIEAAEEGETVASRTPREDRGFSPRRVLWITGSLVVLGAVIELVLFRTWIGALSLTAAGVVAMINFRWLEVIVHRVLQPGKADLDRWTLLRVLGRFFLLACVLAAFLVVPRIDPVAVTLGFSTLVVALVVEGLRGDRVGGG